MLESQAFKEYAPLIAQLQKDRLPDGTATLPAVPEDDDDDEEIPQAFADDAEAEKFWDEHRGDKRATCQAL
eukprot:2175292-Pyramimonas_sp.AAC.1